MADKKTDQTEDQVSPHGNFGETAQDRKTAVVDHKPDETKSMETPKKPAKRQKNQVRFITGTNQKP